MVDAVNSGYKAAAQTVSWSANGFDALTDNEWTNASDEIDNSTTKYLLADFEVVLGSAAFTGADSSISLYLIPSIDDTNFADWSGGGTTTDEQENEQLYIGSVTTSGATAAQRLVLRSVSLPPGKFKIGIRNQSGVTLNATNTLKWRPYNYSSQ